MEQGDPAPWADLVEDRLAFLDRLAGEPAHKPQLEEDLDCSRSTIDRAIRELEDADLVARVPDGYVTTVTGRLAADRYRAYVADQRTIEDARPVLSAVPDGTDVPFELVAGGSVEPTDGEPNRAFERVARHLRGADRYRAILPTLADSRHLRLLHARVVHDELDAELLVGEDLYGRLAREFPQLVGDLVSAESCTVRHAEVPPYGLAIADASGATSVVVATYDDGAYVGTVEHDSGSAVDRASEVFASVRDGAERVETRPAKRRDHGTPLSVDGMRAERILGDAGMTRLDRSYFTDRTPGDPDTAWRIGFDLVDVYYGYAVERVDPSLADRSGSSAGRSTNATGPEGARAAVETGSASASDGGGTDASAGQASDPLVSGLLAARLADGDDHVVVGPAGAGKSTICRQVACQWVDADRGPVFYRASSASGNDDLSGLADVVASVDGHALVVVEDAAGGITESFLRFLGEVRDDPSVSVLGEAREREWHDAVDELADPRRRELAMTDLDTYRPPSVDERTCRRSIDAFEAATGREVPLTASALLDRVKNEGGMGEMYVLSYQVVAHTVEGPLLDDAVGSSVLDGDVRATYQSLVGSGEGDPDEGDGTLPLEVGLLVATLTAMEWAVTPGRVHAVAVTRSDERRDRPHRRVERVVDDLDGRMLVRRDDGTAYRTQHPQWATRFLEHALDRAERETVATFENAVNALLELADSPERRDRIESWLGREAPQLRQFAEPEGVAEFVEDLFALGFTRSTLAPLFGTTEHSSIEFPAACPEAARLDAVSCRGKMWYDHGEARRAETELSTLCDLAGDAANDDVRTTYLAEGRRGLGEVVVDRGETDTAREHLRASLDAAREGDDPRHEVGALNSLAWVAMTVDDYDRAQEHLDEARSIAEDLGPCGDYSDTLYYLARLNHFRGDLAAAEEWLAETVDLDRRIGNEQNLSSSLKLLADVAKERGAHDRAADYYRQSIELKRTVADRHGMSQTLYDYGDCLLDRGDVDAAERAFERSLTIARENDMHRQEGRILNGLGRVALERGAHEAARDRFHEGREIHESLDHGRGVASGTAGLGDVARDRDDVDTARQHYREAYETYREIDDTRRAVELVEKLVGVCETAGDEAAALEFCRTGIELCEEASLDDERQQFLDHGEALEP